MPQAERLSEAPLGSDHSPVDACDMSRLKVVLAVLIAPPVLVLGAGFVHGIYLAATGQAPAREEPSEPEAPEVPDDPDARARVESAGAADPGALGTLQRAALPADLTARGAIEWLAAEGLLSMVEGELTIDGEGFARLDVDTAVALHAAARAGGKEHDALRMLLFAWCSEMPKAERRAFAKAAGAWRKPAGVPTGRGYRGEFGVLFFMAAAGDGPVYERAIQRYAAIATSEEVLQGLREFGAYYEEPDSGQWRLRIEERLGGFQPETLMALHDRIGLFGGLGDRKYLREDLRELAEGKARK